jgi:HEAT repeat protein
MGQTSNPEIETLLASTKPEELRRGLALVKNEIARRGSEESRDLFEMVTTLFYIDPLDRPDLVPVLDEAVTLVVGFGKWIIPVLLDNLDTSDLKAQMAISHALGRLGADAIEPLLNDYQASVSDPERQSFILYAMGKIKSPKIVQAAHLALEAADSKDLELRDTGTRAIGKLAETIPPADLPEETRRGFIEKLQSNLADENSGIRAKSVRSLGKLFKHGHLKTEERTELAKTLRIILGDDENHNWDRAYIVRREAKEALIYAQ